MPPALTLELREAFKSAAIKAGLVNGVPLLILLFSTTVGNLYVLGLFVVIVVFILVGGDQIARAFALYKAREAESIVQVAARMTLRQVERTGSKGSKSQHYFMLLDDGTELKIEKQLFENLARLGRRLDIGERPDIEERLLQHDDTVGAYDVQGATVTYEPSSELPLEVLDTAGNTLYRDSAITPRSIEIMPRKK
jgi:hypothetical protein